MNTLKFLIVVSIALLSTDLIYHQVVNGQGMIIFGDDPDEKGIFKTPTEINGTEFIKCVIGVDNNLYIKNYLEKNNLTSKVMCAVMVDFAETMNDIKPSNLTGIK